jgi:hypothetical protein
MSKLDRVVENVLCGLPLTLIIANVVGFIAFLIPSCPLHPGIAFLISLIVGLTTDVLVGLRRWHIDKKMDDLYGQER